MKLSDWSFENSSGKYGLIRPLKANNLDKSAKYMKIIRKSVKMNILEVSDYSWNPSLNNQKKQARICVAIKMKPVLMDINTTVGVGPAISSLDSVGIPRSELLPSTYTTIVLRRGRKLHQLPVLGQTGLVIHHARGRTFCQTTSINLDRDAKAFYLKTLVVESFPEVWKFKVLAGHDFMDANYLRLDDKMLR